MKRTIQDLCEARGESRSDLADALDVTLNEVTTWEFGQVEPTSSRLALEPGRPPSIGGRLANDF